MIPLNLCFVSKGTILFLIFVRQSCASRACTSAKSRILFQRRKDRFSCRYHSMGCSGSNGVNITCQKKQTRPSLVPPSRRTVVRLVRHRENVCTNTRRRDASFTGYRAMVGLSKKRYYWSLRCVLLSSQPPAVLLLVLES